MKKQNIFWFTVAFLALIVISWSFFKSGSFKAPYRSFIIPSSGMASTVIKGDFIIGTSAEKLQRGAVAIFHYPVDRKTMFIERVVAKGGDEIVYVDKKLYVHFSEGDAYIKEQYPKDKIKKFRTKLWVENPYMSDHNGIAYKPLKKSLFEYLKIISSKMEPIYVEELNSTTFKTDNSEQMNAFYAKVAKNSYFMVGDNRDNSADSRLWGDVDENLIYGLAQRVYFNPTHLSRIGFRIE